MDLLPVLCWNLYHITSCSTLTCIFTSLQEKDKPGSGGRFQSLANFFQNLGPNKSRNSGKSSGESSSESGVGSHSPTRLSGPNALPPIASQSKGRLTVDTLPAQGISVSPRVSPTSTTSRPTSSRTGNNRPVSGRNTSSSSNKVIYPVRTKTAKQLK